MCIGRQRLALSTAECSLSRSSRHVTSSSHLTITACSFCFIHRRSLPSSAISLIRPTLHRSCTLMKSMGGRRLSRVRRRRKQRESQCRHPVEICKRGKIQTNAGRTRTLQDDNAANKGKISLQTSHRMTTTTETKKKRIRSKAL